MFTKLEDETYSFSAGNSVLFDGRIPHKPQNTGTTNATMIIVYFFES
ncbi:cupin domain-containing protein [Mucilaginibacter gracilis]